MTVPTVPDCAEPISAQSLLTVPCAYIGTGHSGLPPHLTTTDSTVPFGTVNLEWPEHDLEAIR